MPADPQIPFLNSSGDLLFFVFVFARIAGLMLVSPLLYWICNTRTVRLALTLFTSMILAVVLYPQYQGSSATMPPLPASDESSWVLVALLIVKEMGIGYLIGFVFALLYEAVVFAGQTISMMMGFSIAEVLDPVTQISHTSISRLLTLSTSLLILSLDLHHAFFRVAAESFTTLPLGQYGLAPQALEGVAMGAGTLFQFGLKFVLAPFVILTLATIGLGFLSRVVPELNIFMFGLPLKILIGLYVLIVTLHSFPTALAEAYNAYLSLAKF